ncbi:MAG TPA: hypothetical protein VE983_12055, partial [Solirubrobacteraceae bacterium]|nr:hypothetical protein [Solirubrobacteraceae bacterium]
LLADLQLAAGALTAALEAIARGQEQMARTGERLIEAELLRTRARVLLAGPEPDTGVGIAQLQQAVEVAERQGARLSQLRALRQLVVQRRRAGQDATADEGRLAVLCQGFAPDSQLPDLRRARAVLQPATSR